MPISPARVRRLPRLAGACLLSALALLPVRARAADDAPGGAAGAPAQAAPAPEPEASTPPGAVAAGPSRGPLVVAMRIAQALELSDEQTKALSAEMRRAAQERRALYAQRSGLESQLQAQLAQKPVDEAAVAATTERLVALDRQIALLPDALWQAIRPGLSAEQGARLILLRGELKKRGRGERRAMKGRGADEGAAD